MNNSNEIVGYLKTYDKKGAVAEPTMDEGVLIEVTEAKADGTVELAWNDRNERVYVQLKISDLLSVAMAVGISS